MALQVALSGQSISTASGPSSLLNDTQPLTKLDVTNIVSFQTIRLLFNSEPPQPPASSPYYTNTLIKSFTHGYSYTPTVWMLWQNPSPASPASPGSGSSATNFYTFGDDTGGYDGKTAMNGTFVTATYNNYCAEVFYNNGSGAISSTLGFLYVTADDKNINLYFMKYSVTQFGGSAIPLYMAGTTLNIRLYVFTEPATTSNY